MKATEQDSRPIAFLLFIIFIQSPFVRCFMNSHVFLEALGSGNQQGDIQQCSCTWMDGQTSN